MNTKFYRVAFVTKMGGWQNWVIDLEEQTAKAARAKAEQMWSEHHKAHMFNVQTRVLKPIEEFLYHYFVKTEVRA